MAEIRVSLEELRNFIEQNQTLMAKMDGKVRLSVVDNKIRVGIVPLNPFTIGLLNPGLFNLFIQKFTGIHGVKIRKVTLSNGHISIEFGCEKTSESEIAASNGK